MIFRSIYRRRVRFLFGQFMDEKALDRLTSRFSEWSCFIQLLPQWVRPLFGRHVSYITPKEVEALASSEKVALSGRGDKPN